MTRRLLQGICVLVAAVVIASLSAAHASAQTPVSRPTSHPQLSWAHVGRKPLSDAEAASLVTREPEVRPDNQSANRYRPTNVDLWAFRAAKSGFHQTPVQANPWNAYVTGRTDLRRPTTDMIIQWAAHKWGIPENTLRALGSFEAGWHMEWGGDLTEVPSRWYMQYPPQARSTGGSVWLSMGITQVKWKPDGSVNSGTQRLRWISTAFNLDYAAATIRYYYDGKCKWCGRGYHAGQQWGSIGAWNQPTPWGNEKARWYISKVKEALAMHGWTRPGW
jgi:hypothetical protein